MADVFNKTPAEFIDINTMFDVLNNRVGFEAEQLRAIVENTYWLYNYALEYHIPADSAMSDASTNAVQNKVIKAYVDNATSGLATLGNTLTNTRKNAVRILPSSTLGERLDIRPLEFSPTDITQADDIDISEFFLTTPTEYMICHLKDATARADILDLETKVDNLESQLSGFATTENLNAVAGRVDTLESAIGDIGTLLDTINGEVI